MGFAHVESGPLVRSSYHAHEQADGYRKGIRDSGLGIRARRSFAAFLNTSDIICGVNFPVFVFCRLG